MTPSRTAQEALYREQMDDEALAGQKREAATKCKSCSAPIRWGRDGSKHVALDYDEHEGGNTFLFPDGGCYTGKQDDPTPADATRHYRHRATCKHPLPVQERIA